MLQLDSRGYEVSAAHRQALDAFERALASLLAHRGDVHSLIGEALALDPSLGLGHCLRAVALLLGGPLDDRRLRDALRGIAHEAPIERERRHAGAALAWLAGDTRAASRQYGDLVDDHPRDVLALVAAHALDFRTAQREMLRDRMTRALRHWDEGDADFGHLLAMHAFGLEETGDYAGAEAQAHRALELIPDNAAAIHVITHVMEMQGRAREGIEWLESMRTTWSRNAGFANHIAWHLALFHLDSGATGRALEVYDDVLAPHRSSAVASLVDASSLLWRLELRGCSLGSRWRSLARCWKGRLQRGERAFNVIHALIAFSGARRPLLARRAYALLGDDAGDDIELATALGKAVQAFVKRDYALAIQRLSAVRAIAHRCGGSVAQCDLIHLTLTEAALRGQRAQLARTLTAERAARKPESLLNQWLFARAAAFGVR